MSGGHVLAIFVAPRSGEPMGAVDRVAAAPGRGLEGDRYYDSEFIPRRSGRERAEVTLIESEVIDHLRHELGVDVQASDSRRNIVTRGLRLDELVGREFEIGDVRLAGTELCEPCVSLVAGNATLLRGLVHKGGLCARVLTSGTIRVGDPVAERGRPSGRPLSAQSV